MKELGFYLEQVAILADRIERRKSDLQEAAAQDAGFPAKVTGMEVDLGVQYLHTINEELPWIENREPYGTVAAIFPYDAPAVMLARLGGSALITGNRLLFSFSSQIPRSARVISDICKSIPSLEPVFGLDNREFGNRCVRDERVRVLFMSGASGVGEAYRKKHEAFDKLFFAGPGGMPVAAVFEDADPGAAARFIGRRAFINGGQYCTTLKKALIHRKLFNGIRDKVVEKAISLKVGDPLDLETDIGPTIVERTRLTVRNALEKFSDARLLSGGIDGEVLYPIVLEADANLPIPDLELFGAFLLLKPFDDPEEAVQEIIRTRYGFLLAFFGSPPEGGPELFHEHFGMVHDNPDFFFTPLRLPFGGKKESGWILERQGHQWNTRDGAFIYSNELARRDTYRHE
jgi:acyl-CoA reductase-like NAD-dependent aldehyde dehydrogenase